MLEVIEESQENTEILRRDEPEGRLLLLHKNSTDGKGAPDQRTINYFSCSPSLAYGGWGEALCHGPPHTLKMKKCINNIRQWLRGCKGLNLK